MKLRIFVHLFILIVASMMFLDGCKSKTSSTDTVGTTYVYHLTGIVVGLPVPMQGPPSLQILTHVIPNWVGIDGKIDPMAAMTMPYQLAPGLSIVGIHVGDNLAFTYKVNWIQDRMLVTRIRKLPLQIHIQGNPPAIGP